MKLTGRYKPREIMGELVLVPCGEELSNFNGIKTINGVGRIIFEMLEDTDDDEIIVRKILEEYDCDEETVRKDVTEFIKSLREENVIE